MSRTDYNAITDVPGIQVGHAQDLDALTGCTVVLCPDGAVGGVDVRGGAPGTRETDLLRPLHMVQECHAVLLAGGSAFGLDAAGGVMRYLEEQGVGFDVGVARVPIVPGAILFDLDLGDPAVRPDAAMGYAACTAASDGSFEQGSVGAGTGAQVGRMFGPGFCMKGGIGSASLDIGGGVVIGALVAVNAYGDVFDPEAGQIIAGARKPPRGHELADTLQTLGTFIGKVVNRFALRNTVIGVVATNARLTKEEANKVAQTAHNGIARTVRPAHTMLDGDVLFCLATGKTNANANVVAAYAPEVVARAVVNGIRAATTLGGCLAAQDFPPADG